MDTWHVYLLSGPDFHHATWGGIVPPRYLTVDGRLYRRGELPSRAPRIVYYELESDIGEVVGGVIRHVELPTPFGRPQVDAPVITIEGQRALWRRLQLERKAAA